MDRDRRPPRENELGGIMRRASGTFSFRPGPRWQLSVAPSYERADRRSTVRVDARAAGRPETYGSRYVFAYIERSTFSTEFRMGFTLKPDLNLDVYAEPFASSGHAFST